MTITSHPANKNYRDNWPFGEKAKATQFDDKVVVDAPPVSMVPLRPGAINDIIKLWLHASGAHSVFTVGNSGPEVIAVTDLPKLAEYIQNALRP